MKEKLKKFRGLLTEIIASIIIFMFRNYSTVINKRYNSGWDPVGNVKNFFGSAFIGVISIVLLYILFMRKK